MLRIKILSIITLCIFFESKTFSQSLEVGIMGGGVNYMGDLSDMIPRMELTKPAGGICLRYNPDRYVGLRASYMYGNIGGADSLSSNTTHKLRNLSFQSVIIDFNFQVEWNFLGFCFPEYVKKYGFSPYAFVGLNLFKFNPKTYYKGQLYELQPLGTEGQGTTDFQDRTHYALTQFSIPLGAGLKFRFSDNWNMGMEFAMRVPFTDYIDDVSTTYVDPDYLSRHTSEYSGFLSDRSGEINKGINVGWSVDNQNNLRGNKNTPNDFLMFGTISLCYRFPLPGTHCTNY